MMVSKEQARSKWCPFVRHTTYDSQPSSANRRSSLDGELSNPSQCRCISDECMSWRKVDDVNGFCGLTGPITEYEV